LAKRKPALGGFNVWSMRLLCKISVILHCTGYYWVNNLLNFAVAYHYWMLAGFASWIFRISDPGNISNGLIFKARVFLKRSSTWSPREALLKIIIIQHIFL